MNKYFYIFNLTSRISLILCLTLFSLCHTLSAQKSAFGRDFWFTFPKNDDTSSRPFVYFSFYSPFYQSQSGRVTVDYLEIGGSDSHTIGSGSDEVKSFGRYMFGEEYMTLEEGIDNYTIHISSEIDIMLRMHSQMHSSTLNHGDASLVLPTASLGTEYYVITHNETKNRLTSQVDIVATTDSTYIDIIPSTDTRTMNAGEKTTIFLRRGQRQRLQSRGDLTGTSISLNKTLSKTCAPFAVFAGNSQTTIGGSTYSGHIFNQVMPVNFYGKNYMVVPFAEGSEYLLKVLALESNTTVFVDGNSTGQTLGAGEYLSLLFDDPKQITVDKPVYLGQFFKGYTNLNTNLADPFMTYPTAKEHLYTNNYLDSLPGMSATGNTDFNYKSIIFPSSDRPFFNHPSTEFGDNLKTFPPDPSFSYSIYKQDNEFQSFEKRGNRGALFNYFSLGDNPSRAHMGIAGNLEFIETETLNIDIEPGPLENSPKVYCPNSLIDMTADFFGEEGLNPKYDTFEWDFGDGFIAAGILVSHEYENAGSYTVTLRASDSDALCSTEEVTSVSIRVEDTSIESIVGAKSVCPNVERIRYDVSGYSGNSYNWEVSGGTIVHKSQSSVFVNWGDSSPNAYIRAISENDLGCVGDTLTYAVIINETLNPEIPSGPTEICFNELTQIYNTPRTHGSYYQWHIENGKVIAGQGTNEVTVQWDGKTRGTIYFTESSTTRTDVCSGDSPILEVQVLAELTRVLEKTDISCFGESDGQIDVIINGGKAPYEVVWNHGEVGNSLSGLGEGSYVGMIIDALGCQIEISAEIIQPELLEAELIIENIRCNGETNGSAKVLIEGGTAPYLVYLNGGTQDLGTFITSLSAGNHSLRIVDSKSCEFIKNFEILEPPPLTAITTDSPTCPEEGTGTIFVEAEGGTRPYTYRWNTSPPQDAQLIVGLPAGKYSVTVTDANGCIFTFPNEEIGEKSPHVNLPNAFSPNGDGVNDGFQAVFDCATNFDMKIFSRWGGEVIFHSEDINLAWDGNYQGVPAPEGSYSYVVSYWGESNGQNYREIVRGSFKLIR